MSFNINSVRSRLEIIIPFLHEKKPDIVGLQEIKVENHIFPTKKFEELGYHLYINGQKSYHGVATLVKEPVLEVDYDFIGQKEQRRMIITKHNFGLVVCNGYFPQGENKEHPQKFPYKQGFYQEFLSYLKNNFDLSKDKILIMGDLNIAPEDIDIGIGDENKKKWLKTGKCSFLPEERIYTKELKEIGFFDTFRQLHPTIHNRFSWFDYRSRGFDTEPKKGLRIDQIWVTKPLMDHCKTAEIDYELRRSNRPSDHCAIFAEINIK